jgi:hypothetical protein
VNVNLSEGGNVDDVYYNALEQQGIVGELVDNKICNLRMYAFAGSALLTSASLLNAHTLFGYAFNGCPQLAHVNLPQCTEISSFVFNGCKSLSSVVVPLVERIGDSAFYTCGALVEIELPKCTTIAARAFGFCKALNKITLGSPTMCTLENADAFRNIDKSIQIEVPADLLATYQADPVWSAVTGATLEFVAIA